MLASDATSGMPTPVRLATAERPACVGRKCWRYYVSFPPPNCCLDEVSRRLEQIERPRGSVEEEFPQRVGNHSTGFLNRPATREQRSHLIQRGHLFCVEFQLLHQAVQRLGMLPLCFSGPDLLRHILVD